MITRILYNEEKDQYNSVITHPIQSWEWGDFLTGEGHKVYRLGIFENNKIIGGYSLNFHTIPKTNFKIGVFQKGPRVDQEMINNVTRISHQENALFVKFEPEVIQKTYDEFSNETNHNIPMDFPNMVISPKVAFYPFTYLVNLTKSEDQLLENMHTKTRYNIKVANRHNVQIVEMTNDAGFEIYLKLLFDTTKRQGFYLHSTNYHRHLWEILKKTSIPHIMLAQYNGQTLSAFMIFTYKNRLFYPYGASLDVHRETMASTLLMWETIKMGKKLGCTQFDMWGSLGPKAHESENGYGFHRFKQGFGGQLVQFVGSYDLVIDQPKYQIYNLVDKYRWKFLHLKAKIL